MRDIGAEGDLALAPYRRPGGGQRPLRDQKLECVLDISVVHGLLDKSAHQVEPVLIRETPVGSGVW